MFKKKIKATFPRSWHVLRTIRLSAQLIPRIFGKYPRICNICGFTGKFLAEIHFPDIFTYDALCPQCGSLPRNRMAMLIIRTQGLVGPKDRLLHFAPEPCLRDIFAQVAHEYTGADIAPTHPDRQLNIEDIDLPDSSIDIVYCSHVLEHVDHRQAITELHRILAPGGRALCLFPFYPGWRASYENPDARQTPDLRALHFGKDNHVRRFGADITEVFLEAGFTLELCTATGEETVRHGLIPGEVLFVARR